MADDKWRGKLDELTYKVCRLGHTEPPFSGKLLHVKDKGTYHCVCCEALLFDSSAKFDSGCGWPSFDKVKDTEAVTHFRDDSHGMIRTEIRCSNCGSHLGHLFYDGLTDSGKRYCVNSISLIFAKAAN